MKREKHINRRSRPDDIDILNNINVADPTFNQEVRDTLISYSEEISNIDLVDIISIAPSGSFNISKQPSMPSPKSEGYTKANETLLRQTMTPLDNSQPSLFDALLKDNPDYKNQCNTHNIDRIGANLSVSSRYALHAIQTLFTDTDYKGNTKDGSLQITISDYLEVYGVKKSLTKRGKHEYNRQARDEAIEALRDLGKPVLWSYMRLDEEQTKKKKKKIYKRWSGVEPIITLREEETNITEEEKKKIDNGELHLNKRVTQFVIKPSDIFLVSGAYVLIPRGLIDKIRLQYKKPTTHLLTFVTLLCLEAKHKNTTLKRYYDTLATTLNLQYLIETRQKRRLSEFLEEDFTRAKELGLLTSYKTGKDYKGEYVELELNINAFYQENRLKGEQKLSLPEKPLEEPVKPLVETL